MAKLYKEEELKEMLEKLQKSGCPYICLSCGRATGVPSSEPIMCKGPRCR